MMWVCLPCIQRSCSTVMVHTLNVIPVSELVTCTFSTIPICHSLVYVQPIMHTLCIYIYVYENIVLLPLAQLLLGRMQ